jgi:hypothetical protein
VDVPASARTPFRARRWNKTECMGYNQNGRIQIKINTARQQTDHLDFAIVV